ncbi:MAG: hypothetical protein ACYCY0_04505 [Acidithiobacillus ferrivorans]
MRVILQKHRRQPRQHEMPNASKVITARLRALREKTDLEDIFSRENFHDEGRYNYAKEIGHDH